MAEVDYLKNQVIPVIQRTLSLYEQNKTEMEEELRVLKQEVTGKTGSMPPKENPPEKVKSSPLIETLEERPQSSIAKASLRSPKPSDFFPSFSKGKRVDGRRSGKK